MSGTTVEVLYDNQGMMYPPTTELSGLWRTTFHAQSDLTIRTDIVQVIPLRMTFDLSIVRGLIVAPMYLGQSLNIGSNFIMQRNEVYVALLESRLKDSDRKYDEVIYLKAGDPLVAVHSLDPIQFVER